MSVVSTAIASRVLRVSKMHTHRLFARLGFRPTSLKGGKGAYSHRWGVRHLLGVMTTVALMKTGVPNDHAEGVGRTIGAESSDEQVEAAILDGRHYVLIVGRQPLPRLVSADAIRATEAEYADTVREYGLSISALDIRPLYDDLLAAVTAATQEREGVSDATAE